MIELGQKVKISGYVEFVYSKNDKKMVTRNVEPERSKGIVVMKTRRSEGYRYYEEFGCCFDATKIHDVYLVAYDLKRKPVEVLPEQINPT